MVNRLQAKSRFPVLRYRPLHCLRDAVLLFTLGLALSLRAQPFVIPPGQDPLMSMMLSQPKIDLVSPVEVVAVFDPPVVAPGQQTIYRVTLTGLEASTEWPKTIEAPFQLEMQPSAHSEVLRLVGNRFQPFTTFNYRVRATAAGEYTVPEFNVNVYGKAVTVPAAKLQVMAGAPVPVIASSQLSLTLSSTNLYAGQAVRARVILPGVAIGAMQGLTQVQLTGDGFLTDVGGARQRVEMTPNANGRMINYVYETTLTPVSVGRLPVFAQGYAVSQRMGGPIIMSGTGTISLAPPQYTLLESTPIEVTVRPLPEDGELPGFTGAIGDFTLGTPRISTNFVQVGDTIRLTVAVTNHGVGPLARVVPPPPPRLQDWQVVEATDPGPPQAINIGMGDIVYGVTTFNYTLIPLNTKTQSTPPIPFSYFDTARGTYVNLTIPPIPLNVEAGAIPADASGIAKATGESAPPDNEPQLSRLAPAPGRATRSLMPAQQRGWFFLVQLAPAAAFAGLLWWDRRRRYFERHPEVLLRRRARRALHREWRTARQAAQAKDAAAFAAAAVSAMRVASAPHYPAEPRALVGSDVAALIPEADSDSGLGSVVRQFFAVMDASRFAATAADAKELLGLQPDLDRVLQQLEARLS